MNSHCEIITDADAIDILQTNQDEVDVGEFFLECMEMSNIKADDRDVLTTATLPIELNKPFYCLICNKAMIGKNKNEVLVSITAHYTYKINDKTHKEAYLKAKAKSLKVNDQSFLMTLVTYTPPPPAPEATTPKKFQCKECDKSFEQKGNLNVHCTCKDCSP